MKAYVIKDSRLTGSTLYIREEGEHLLLTIVHDDKAAVIALNPEEVESLKNVIAQLRS